MDRGGWTFVSEYGDLLPVVCVGGDGGVYCVFQGCGAAEEVEDAWEG